MLPRYHLCSLDIADQCALHPDQHQALGPSDQGRGFAVTGCPCRSTLSAWISISGELISSAAAPGDIRSEASVGALSLRPLLLCQRLYTYSSRRKLSLLRMCADYTYFGRASQPGQLLAHLNTISPAGMGTPS